MSQHAAFRRVAVDGQMAEHLDVMTFPAPTRGLVLNENEAFTQPGGAQICDNWRPTMKGVSLRGGCSLWCQLPETTPIISSFNYDSGINHKMFAANATKLYDVSTGTPTAVATGRTSGNYAASQLANQGGDWLIAVNDAGDAPLRYNGTSWTSLAIGSAPNWANSTLYNVGNRRTDPDLGTVWVCASVHTSPASGTFAAARAANPAFWNVDLPTDGVSWITGPPGSAVAAGGNLTYVCKYRNRYFFIEKNSMNAWYLPLNAVGGTLLQIPLSGAATKGGKLLFCASWSIDAGDGIDDKLVFCTDLGELIIFTGSDPSVAANWRQEGRYDTSPPMGMNAHIAMGGDLLIATVDGIIPTTAAITKTREELELAAITRPIKDMWRDEVNEKREWAWSMFYWHEYGAIFVTWPGGDPGKERCAVVNAATNAWARYTGWDATCFMPLGDADMFFGTQTGAVMHADRGGYDNGVPYTATLVGGWETFKSPAQTITWLQARASFSARSGETFIPQISACTDFVVSVPTPPPPGPDPGPLDLWDEGVWDTAEWDAPGAVATTIRNTGWVSIGATGFSHAPIVQIQVAQEAKPRVDLIAVSATFRRMGVNV